MTATSEQLIARDRELGVLLEALDHGRPGTRAVLLEGEPGVGKTVLWGRALSEARSHGWRALVAAPSASEERLAFATLGDLFERDADDALERLPGPQREALEIALLRRHGDLGDSAVGTRLIGVATLGVLRSLAGRGPLLLAIDDVQWIDHASGAALRFALRRLRDEQIAVIATRRLDHRSGVQPELERLLGDDRAVRIRLKPLSSGGVHELLASRLGLEVARSTLVRVHDVTGGNPFFTLEIGRELQTVGEPAADEPLPVPGSLRDLIHARLKRLSPDTRTVLLAAAALARPTRSILAGFSEGADTALDEAISAGMLELTGERVRFTHPLLASVHYEQSPLTARREVHRRLGELVETGDERVRHLALASSGVDDRIASQLDRVAHDAAHRGAPLEAAELCDLSARLTPPNAERQERILVAAEYHYRAGNLKVAAGRATDALDDHAEPAARARAIALLGSIAGDTQGTDAAVTLYRRALREPGVPREQRADVHQKLTWIRLVGGDARQAERHARAMWRLLASSDDPNTRAIASATLAHVIAVSGRPVPDQLLADAFMRKRPASPAQSWTWSVTGPGMLEPVVLLWSGEVERARAPLERILGLATECEDPWLEMHALAYLSSVETHLGRPTTGLALAERYLELANSTEQAAQRAGALWPISVAAAWLGLTTRAKEAAREGLTLAERTGHRLYAIGNLTALGAVELALDQPAAAVEMLEHAWAIAERGGIGSPSRFPILADAVQAQLAVGDLPRASALGGELRRIAEALSRPWILALSARCDALIADAKGETDRSFEALQAALTQHVRQDRPLDRARTLLAAGSIHRRMQMRRAAREQLEQAIQIFDGCEARLWSERARLELARIGGRRASSNGTFSATESEIIRLVTAGRTNREVAAALHLSDKTVEWNLSKLYRKVGVRSRTELASALARSPETTPEFREERTSKSGDISG